MNVTETENQENLEKGVGHRWLDTYGFARKGNFSTGFVEKLRAQGSGPPWVKIGRLVRYREDLIDEWIASHNTVKAA